MSGEGFFEGGNSRRAVRRFTVIKIYSLCNASYFVDKSKENLECRITSTLYRITVWSATTDCNK